MRYLLNLIIGSALAVSVACVAEEPSKYSIPVDKQDIQKVYYGTANSFQRAAKIDYESVIKATPEYGEVKKKKLEPGTGKYWILLSQASERAAKAISEVGHETGYDFIAAQAYLGGLEPSIPSEDITPLVMDRVRDEDKPVKGELKIREREDGRSKARRK